MMKTKKQYKENVSRIIQSKSVNGRLHLIDNRNISLPENSIHEKVPLQRQLNRQIIEQSRSRYDVEYCGTVIDFQGGIRAGSIGITGVRSYGATATVGNLNGNVNKNADTREYHRGHLLPQILGGSGSGDNIFEQDGGQNTTGSWPSFERSVASQKDSCASNVNMTYRIYLNGQLNYNQQL